MRFISIESFEKVLNDTNKPDEELTHTDIWARFGVLSNISTALVHLNYNIKGDWSKRQDLTVRERIKENISKKRKLNHLLNNNSNRLHVFICNNPEWEI